MFRIDEIPKILADLIVSLRPRSLRTDCTLMRRTVQCSPQRGSWRTAIEGTARSWPTERRLYLHARTLRHCVWPTAQPAQVEMA